MIEMYNMLQLRSNLLSTDVERPSPLIISQSNPGPRNPVLDTTTNLAIWTCVINIHNKIISCQDIRKWVRMYVLRRVLDIFQVFTWDASISASCIARSAMSNTKGMATSQHVS